jgi:thiopeptide-type bacteriocin biosynthesis protein
MPTAPRPGRHPARPGPHPPTDRSWSETVPSSLFRAWNVFLLRAPLHGPAADRGGSALTAGLRPEDGRPALLDMIGRAGRDSALTEAVTLASPSLRAVLDRVGTDGPATRLRDTQLRRAALALLRYDIRAATRPTPFGVFAGVTTGRFDVAAKLARGRCHRTRTHADMQWLLGVVAALEGDPALLPALRVQTHSALRTRGDRLVLACPSSRGAPPVDDSRGSVSLRRTALVDAICAAAAEQVGFGVLADELTARFAPDAGTRVRALMATLVAEEVLVTELRPPLDGGDPLRHVIKVLRAAGADCAALEDIDARRGGYDRLPVGAGIPALDGLIAAAGALHPYPTPLHVDTAVDIELTMPACVRAEIERAAELMWRMSRPKLGLSGLRPYHRRFLERYGADRLVPLPELLDDGTALGPPPGYSWPASEAAPDPGPAGAASVAAGEPRLLAALLAVALRRGEHEIVLDDATVATLSGDSPDEADVPDSLELSVQVVAPDVDAIGDGRFLVTLSPGPGSHRAGATFARFSDLLGRGRDEVAAELAAVPVRVSGALTADIAFLPRSGKAANLAHTVPATGRRIAIGLPDTGLATELRLADLAVGATLDRLCIVHLPSGREVAPVLGNMVSPTAQAPNAARLLWEIGLEGQRLWEPWSWGPLADSPFVPRVRHGRFVLSPAVWRLDELRAAVDEPDWSAVVNRWRARWDVPRRVLLVTFDQRLLVDLDDPWHRDLLREEARRDVALVAQEVPGEREGWAGGDVCGHLTELVVPLVRRDPAPRRAAHVAYRDPARDAGPGPSIGGEWLYLTVHGPARGQDDFLRERLPVLVATAREHGADRWFFLRYTDTHGHHVRLRVHGDQARLWSRTAVAIGALLAGWQRDGVVGPHRVDQYDPEIERYGGGASLAAAEHVFQADSEAAVALLRIARLPATPYPVDTLAAISVAALAADFGPVPCSPTPDPTASPAAVDVAAHWLSRTGTRRDLPPEYRRDPAVWRRLIDPVGGFAALAADPVGRQVLSALAARRSATAGLLHAIGSTRGPGSTPPGRLIGSLLHMTCNRLLGGDPDRERTVIGLARGAVQDNRTRRGHTT